MASITTPKTAVVTGPSAFTPRQTRLAVLNLTPAAGASTASVNSVLNSIFVMRDLLLKLSVTVQFGATAPVAGDIKPGDEWGIISNINLNKNGGIQLWNSTGEVLAVFNYLTGRKTRIVPANLRTLPAANAAATFTSTLSLPRKMFNSTKPLDFSLNCNIQNQVGLNVSTNPLTAFLSTAGATLTSVKLTVYQDAAAPNNPSNQPEFTDWSFESRQVAFSGASSLTDLLLPPTRIYRAVLFGGKASGAVGAADSNILNELRVMPQGLETEHFYDIDTLQSMWYDEFRLVPSVDLPFANTSWNPAAWAAIDFAKYKYLTESYNTVGYTSVGIEAGTSGAGTLNVFPVLIYPTQVVSTNKPAAAATAA